MMIRKRKKGEKGEEQREERGGTENKKTGTSRITAKMVSKSEGTKNIQTREK